MIPETNADAKIALPSTKPKDGRYFVAWQEKGGDFLRTIYRWKEGPGRRLAAALLRRGIPKAWLVGTSEIAPWDAVKIKSGVIESALAEVGDLGPRAGD